MLVAYVAASTWLGARLAGKQSTIREFFLGGRKLPWYAVAGSIVATEISAVTFISAPAIVFAPGGDLRYLQLMIGALLARIIIALWFVPAFYQREIFSPYEYIGNALGAPARGITTGLFMLGAVLGQSVRLLLTAMILEELSGLPLTASIWIIGAIAAVWTLLGGITTVIWTDVIQFFVFIAALAGALIFVIAHVPGGWSGIVQTASEAGKLRLWDTSASPKAEFTLWTAVIANTLLCLNAYGTDQMIAQRMFCCRGPRAASVAILASSVGLLVSVLAMSVGLGLYAYYQHYPLDADAAARVAEAKDRIFPIFIVREIPPGLTGLVIAGVFAAAISSLDSVLAALSQTVLTGLIQPWRAWRRRIAAPPTPPPERDAAVEAADLRLSRALVVLWTVALCLMAQVVDAAREHYGDILRLALAMATYTGGAMLAAFMLALLRLNVDYRGLLWSAPLSVLTVFAVSWHAPWALWTTVVLAAALFVAWCVHLWQSVSYWATEWWRDAPKTGWVALGCALPVALCAIRLPGTGEFVAVAWPWNVPIGFVVAFALGYVLARPRPGERQRDADAPRPQS